MRLYPERGIDRVSAAYDKYGQLLYKICYIMLCHRSDAEDAVQEAFLRFLRSPHEFADDRHEKAWFIRVASNVCRDKRRLRFRQRAVPLHEVEQYAGTREDAGVLLELLALPEKCKAPVYLHYVEGYSVSEIADMLGSPESTVKSWLFRGRQKLRMEL